MGSIPSDTTPGQISGPSAPMGQEPTGFINGRTVKKDNESSKKPIAHVAKETMESVPAVGDSAKLTGKKFSETLPPRIQGTALTAQTVSGSLGGKNRKSRSSAWGKNEDKAPDPQEKTNPAREDSSVREDRKQSEETTEKDVKVAEGKEEVAEGKEEVAEGKEEVAEGSEGIVGKEENIFGDEIESVPEDERRVLDQIFANIGKIDANTSLSKKEKDARVVKFLIEAEGTLSPETFEILLRAVERKFHLGISMATIVTEKKRQEESYGNRTATSEPHSFAKGPITVQKIVTGKGVKTIEETTETGKKRKGKFPSTGRKRERGLSRQKSNAKHKEISRDERKRQDRKDDDRREGDERDSRQQSEP